MMKKTIVLTMMAVCSLSIQAQFSGKGSGTEKDPYQVTNADELFEVRNDLTAYYKQMNDIDLTEWIREESPTQGWMPIGNSTTPFKGSYDGDGYAIKGLTINRTTMDNVGLFGYTQGGSLRNMLVVDASVQGGNQVAVIAGVTNYGTDISECQIISPVVFGSKCVGGIAGYCKTLDAGMQISNNSVVGGKIEGKSLVGGIIGSCGQSNSNGTYKSAITRNYTSCKIFSEESIAGIANVTSYASRYSNSFQVNDNLSESYLRQTNNINSYSAGILNIYSHLDYTTALHNIFLGTLRSDCQAFGIGNIYSSASISNFCLSDTLYSSTGIVYRIGSSAKANNYAYNGTIVYQRGKLTTVEDGNEQGTGYGLRTLKKESTYVGAGFDFTDTWTIKEGETFPYLKAQVAPVTITSFEAGNKATIKGTAAEGTTVYVMVGDMMYESYILDGQWEVSLGRVNVGTEAKVYAMSRGRMPSIAAKATAENGSSTTPEGKSGDANGDNVVDSADVTAIINYILGKPGSSFNKDNADVTGDGEILIDDAVQTVQLIMNAQ